jgi:hypothetical protein
MRWFRLYLRSVPGQLMLFGGVFLGAAVVGCLPYFFRESFFERGLREQYADLEGYAAEAIRVLSSPHSDEEEREKVYDELRKRDKKVTDATKRWKNLESLYGAWARDDVPGDADVLARRLVEFQPDWVLQRLRQTLAAGDADQRGRGVEFLKAVAREKGIEDEVRQLARAAEEKARRRGEAKVARLAKEVLE